VRSTVNTEQLSQSNDTRAQDMLLAESASSVAFTNILFAVSLAILAISGESLKKSPQTACLLFVLIVSSFYSSIFYAVIAGNVVRLWHSGKSIRAMHLGNAISEYFGVFIVIALIPLLALMVTNDGKLAWIAYGINVVGYAIYTISGLDLLSRVIASRTLRFLVSFIFMFTVAALVHFASAGAERMAWVSTVVILLLSLLLSITHVLRTETNFVESLPEVRP